MALCKLISFPFMGGFRNWLVGKRKNTVIRVFEIRMVNDQFVEIKSLLFMIIIFCLAIFPFCYFFGLVLLPFETKKIHHFLIDSIFLLVLFCVIALCAIRLLKRHIRLT